MSKFFDETQKARQWAPQVPDNGRLDVVSVIDAIKQSEPTSVTGAGFNEVGTVMVTDKAESGPATKLEIEAEKPGKGLIKTYPERSSLAHFGGRGVRIAPDPSHEAPGIEGHSIPDAD